MEAKNLEAGLIKKPLLANETSDAIKNRDSSSGAVSSDSSVTACVVFCTLVAVCSSFCYGTAIAYSSPAQSGIMEDLGLSAAEYSIISSVLTVGGVIGASFSGRIVAYMGQRNAMWISEVFCIIGWLAIASAKVTVAWLLYPGRLSIGVGIGLISYVVPLYIAEIAPKNLRGTFSATNQLMTTFGFSTVYITGNMIPWHSLALVGTIPLLVQFIGLFFVPESPRWLAKSGKEKEFRDAILWLRGKNADISQEIAEIGDTMQALKQQPSERFSDLLQRRYLHPLTVGVGLMILTQLGGCASVSFYASSILEQANVSSSIGTSTIAMIQIPAAVGSLYLMDLAGRRPLLMASASGMCLCCFLVSLSFFLQKLHCFTELAPIMAFMGMLGYPTLLSLGMCGIPWIIMSEIFPVNVKASAGSLVTLANWSSSWLTTSTFHFMMEWSYTGASAGPTGPYLAMQKLLLMVSGIAGTFFIFSVVNASTVVFIWKLVPETKGRTLEEIQESFAHSVEEHPSSSIN